MGWRVRPYILGIDPGMNGALAIIKGQTVVEVWDMPLAPRNGRSEIDVYALGALLDPYAKDIELSVVEEVGVMTGKEGRVSLFSFGKNAGIIHGALGVLNIPIYFVKPAIWKGLMGLSHKKSESLTLASKLFPQDKQRWPYLKHDGRAEAVLLAHFGATRFKH